MNCLRISQKLSITIAGFTLAMFGNVNNVLAASFYKITDLGSLINSDNSYALDINNRGQVIFGSGTTSARYFIYTNGKITEISPLLGDTSIAVLSINNKGQAVGNSVNDIRFTGNNPLIYSEGKTQKLIGVNDAIPYGINDQ